MQCSLWAIQDGEGLQLAQGVLYMSHQTQSARVPLNWMAAEAGTAGFDPHRVGQSELLPLP